MVQSYERLEMPDLAASSAKVLEANFPGTSTSRFADKWWYFW
jgi:outer membrane protein assembly factor BamD (BamD/ComL family)